MARLELVVVASIAVLLAGCAGEPKVVAEPNVSPAPNPYLNTLESKLSAWQQLTAERGETYRYVVSAGSVFGPSYNTTLTLQDGEVVRRALTMTEIDDAGSTTVTDVWSETGSAVGSHEEYGATPLSIDERYESCRQTVAKADLQAEDVDLEFVTPLVDVGELVENSSVLSFCFVFSKSMVYDGGGEIILELEFLTD